MVDAQMDGEEGGEGEDGEEDEYGAEGEDGEEDKESGDSSAEEDEPIQGWSQYRKQRRICCSDDEENGWPSAMAEDY